MNSRFLPDINFWLAFNLPAHAHHARVKDRATNVQDPQLFFCRYTQQGLLRLSTTTAITAPYGQTPLANNAALERLDLLLGDPRILFAQEPEGLYGQWSTYAAVATSSPKLRMDAYLAAFAVAGGYRLVTTDKGFKQFKGLNALVL